jgi:homoserine dehydrogenase
MTRLGNISGKEAVKAFQKVGVIMKFNLAIIGFGTVAQGLTEILMDKKEFLKTEHNFEYSIVAVSDILKGSVFNKTGLDPKTLLSLVKETGKITDYPDAIHGWGSLKTIEETNADIIIELSYTDVKAGEPATSHIRAALENRKHVVTSNKGPSALFHKELQKLAEANKVFYKIEGTVMSGTPVFSIAQKCLHGCTINRIRGIVNGTTNYILSQMENGKSYDDALLTAQQLGYAEADPVADVEGWDALAKVVILANVLMKANLKPSDVIREGITKITYQDVVKAKKQNQRYKLIGEITAKDGKVSAQVTPQKLPLTDPLANVMDTTNAITFETDFVGPITVIGKGAGRIETGFAILSDLLDINRNAHL